MKKIISFIAAFVFAVSSFSQSYVKRPDVQVDEFTVTDTLFFGSYGSSYWIAMSGDTVFVNPWLKAPGLTITGDIYNYGTLTGDTASFNVLSAASFAIGSLALDSIYLSYDAYQKFYDRYGATQNVWRMGPDGNIEFARTLKVASLYDEPDVYSQLFNVDLTSSGDYGDKAGKYGIIGGIKMIDYRVLNDGTGAAVDGSAYVILKGLYVQDEHTDQATVTGDTEFAGVVPAGYILKYVIAEETAGNAATLDLGTTSGGNDIFINQTFAASTITTVVINKVFSFTAAQSLFLNDDDAGSSWNSGSLNVYFVLEKITE